MLKHTQTHILLTQLTVENREHTSKTSLCTFCYHYNTKDLSIEQFIHTEATAVVWNGDILTYSICLYIPLVLKLKYLELINQESCCGIQTYKIQVLFQSKYRKTRGERKLRWSSSKPRPARPSFKASLWSPGLSTGPLTAYTTANLVSDTPTQRTSCQTVSAVGQRYQSFSRERSDPASVKVSDNSATEVIKLFAL